jgi:flagellin
MSVINTNVSALLTQNAISKNERSMATAMEQLSTGSRINGAKDDAAGLAISSRMTSQINGLNQSVRNANDAISFLQTADGALIEVENMLQRMRTLAVQASSETNTTDDQAALQIEFAALRTEIDRVANDTQWNGEDILDGTGGNGSGVYSFQIGASASQTLSVTMADFDDAGDQVNGVSASSLAATSAASAAITALDTALTNVNSERATLGANINVLQYSADNLANVSQNAAASRSRVADTDYAQATTELARTQIIAQAATAMLAQANQMPQTVLSLLK